MAVKRKVKKLGNSFALVIPNEIFEFLNFNPNVVKYKITQDETGAVFIVILEKGITSIDEKKFQKQRNSYNVIIPSALYNIWNVDLREGESLEIALSYETSPLKWRIEPA